jgi:hypothetical protein
MDSIIQNKVSESGLVTIDLEKFLPTNPIVSFDLAPFLFMGQILKEKDFRESMQQQVWLNFSGKAVAVFCSADAIIPAWAYMLVASNLSGIASEMYMGTISDMEKHLTIKSISSLHVADFEDRRVVVKGCGDRQIGEYAYMEITRILRPVVKTLMYGEPCSTVPVYKRKP